MTDDGFRWDCGCITAKREDVFVYRPCQKGGCRVRPVVEKLQAEQGTPVIEIDETLRRKET